MTVLSESAFARALAEVYHYKDRQLTYEPGRLSLAGVPQVLIPSHVVACDLPRKLVELLGAEAVPEIMHALGCLVGSSHAATFFAQRPHDRSEVDFGLLTGPFHGAWAGYGDPKILLYEPKLNDQFLIMWESDTSFSAQEALRTGTRGRVCNLLAGYAAGWSAEVTGLPIEAVEIACRAEGVAHCRFVLAHRDSFAHVLADPRLHHSTGHYGSAPAMVFSPSSWADDWPRR